MPTYRVRVIAQSEATFPVDANNEEEAKETAKLLFDASKAEVLDGYVEIVEELVPAPKITPRCWCGAEYDAMGLCPLKHEALTEKHDGSL